MGLVDYSDSETSDLEETSASTPLAIPDPGAPKPSTTFSAQFDSPRSSLPGTPKEISSGPRRIKVNLSALTQTSTDADEEEAKDEPPAKRARTGGAFSGFNSLLPAPKRTAAQNAPKAGVSLKTSGEAAFSRSAPPMSTDGQEEEGEYDEFGRAVDNVGLNGGAGTKETEVKIVGKATRFKPLSVSNKRREPNLKTAKVEEMPKESPKKDTHTKSDAAEKREKMDEEIDSTPLPKPKRSLFSVPQQDEEAAPNNATTTSTYESIITTQPSDDDQTEPHDVDSISHEAVTVSPQQPSSNPNSLQSLTSDLNLTAAQKRQLFGRNGKQDISIAHFNMDSEYAANEQLRQAGEVVEHRAVKAIAPGKHSLQQLVNNARSQQENLEDKWAAGRAARGTMR